MPLKEGTTDRVISSNIKTLVKEGYKPAQAAAIAYDKAGRTKKWAHILPKGSIFDGKNIIPLDDKEYYQSVVDSMTSWIDEYDVPVLCEHKPEGIVYGQVTDLVDADDGMWMGFYMNSVLDKEYDAGRLKWASIGMATNYMPDFSKPGDKPLPAVPLEMSITSQPRNKTRQKLIDEERPTPATKRDLKEESINQKDNGWLHLSLSEDGKFKWDDQSILVDVPPNTDEETTQNEEVDDMDFEKLKEMMHEMLAPLMERLETVERVVAEGRDDTREVEAQGDEADAQGEEAEEMTVEASEGAEVEAEVQMAEADAQTGEMLKELVALREELATLKAQRAVEGDLASKPHLTSMSDKLVRIYLSDRQLYNDVISASVSKPNEFAFSERISTGIENKMRNEPLNPYKEANRIARAEGITYKEAFARLSSHK